MGQFEVEEDGGDDRWVGENRAKRARRRPTRGWSSYRHRRGRGAGAPHRFVRGARPIIATEGVGLGSADGHDGWAKSGDPPSAGAPCEHTVVPVPVDAGWRDEGSEPLEELKRGEEDLGAPVWRRLWEAVQQPGVR
jgi:hypothetical protein